MTRESNVALILFKLRIAGEDFLVLRAHSKWGDWSLVGGHVEPGEDWSTAATREADEELMPLMHGSDFEIVPLSSGAVHWGPTPSRSSFGSPTCYTAKYFGLKLRIDPQDAIPKLKSSEYRLVRQSLLQSEKTGPHLSETLRRAKDALSGGLDAVPLSWPVNLESASVPIEELDLSSEGRGV